MKLWKKLVTGLLCTSITMFYTSYYAKVSSYDLTTLTAQEIKLYAANPDKAYSAKICANKAETFASNRYKKYTLYQGNGDACRHAYWSALMTKNIDRDFAYDAGLAHEGLSRSYSFSGLEADAKMDVSNNYTGRIIGTSMNTATDNQLAYAVADNVNGGKLKRIRTYTSKSSENDKTLHGVMTKYVGYYVATTSGGYISSSTK